MSLSPEITDNVPRQRGLGRWLAFVLEGERAFDPNFEVKHTGFDQTFEEEHPDFGQKLENYISNRLRRRGVTYPDIAWSRDEDPENYIIDLVASHMDNNPFVSAIQQASVGVARSWDASTEKDVRFASSIICLIGRIDPPGAANALYGFSQDKNLETLVREGENKANQALRFLTAYQNLEPFSNIDFWKKYVEDKDPLRYDAGFQGVSLLDPAEALKLIPVYLEMAFADGNSRVSIIDYRLSWIFRILFRTLKDNGDKKTQISAVMEIIKGFSESHPEKAGQLLKSLEEEITTKRS